MNYPVFYLFCILWSTVYCIHNSYSLDNSHYHGTMVLVFFFLLVLATAAAAHVQTVQQFYVVRMWNEVVKFSNAFMYKLKSTTFDVNSLEYFRVNFHTLETIWIYAPQFGRRHDTMPKLLAKNVQFYYYIILISAIKRFLT